MTTGFLVAFLGWCTLINIGLLLWWFLWLWLAHDWVYRMHAKWFKISEEHFDAIHYTAIAFFKLVVIVFNIVPYLALRIIV